MSVTYLKGLRTRYKNLLLNELKKSETLLTEEVEDHGVSGHIIKVNTSFSRLHEFGQKLEETIERFSVAIEKADNKDEMQKLEAEGDTYFELITQIMARKDE